MTEVEELFSGTKKRPKYDWFASYEASQKSLYSRNPLQLKGLSSTNLFEEPKFDFHFKRLKSNLSLDYASFS